MVDKFTLEEQEILKEACSEILSITDLAYNPEVIGQIIRSRDINKEKFALEDLGDLIIILESYLNSSYREVNNLELDNIILKFHNKLKNNTK